MTIPFRPIPGMVIAADHIGLPALRLLSDIDCLPILPALKAAIELSERMDWAFNAKSQFGAMCVNASRLTEATLPGFCQFARLPVADGLKQIKGNCIRPPAQRQGRNKPQ